VCVPPLGDALCAGGGAGAGFGTESAESDGLAIPSSLILYSAGFDATWEIDFFGAAAEAADASLADAQLSLQAQVAPSYINLRSVQQRIALSDAVIARQQRMLELTERRVQARTASRLDLTPLRGQLESTRAEAEPLQS